MATLEPWKMRFTHGHISSKFRNGAGVDDTIDRLRLGDMAFEEFPPLEVFRLTKAVLDDDDAIRTLLGRLDIREGTTEAQKFAYKLRSSIGEVFSLSNRRLFVARVLQTFGLIERVRVQEYDFTSERVQRTQCRDDDAGGQARWLYALSTDNMGWSVDSHCKYRGFEERDRAVHSVELPELTTEEGANNARRLLRNRICKQIMDEHVPSCVMKDQGEQFRVDFSVPSQLLPAARGIDPSVGSMRRPRGQSQRQPRMKNQSPHIMDFLASHGGFSNKGICKGKGKSRAASRGPKRGASLARRS